MVSNYLTPGLALEKGKSIIVIRWHWLHILHLFKLDGVRPSNGHVSYTPLGKKKLLSSSKNKGCFKIKFLLQLGIHLLISKYLRCGELPGTRAYNMYTS
jgi:hypothetical protein